MLRYGQNFEGLIPTTDLGNFVLLWRRGTSVLTAGHLKITRDSRFEIIGDYNLQIANVRTQDAATIRDNLLNDIKELEAIVSEEPDIVKLCKDLKSKINARIAYLRNKLENIPNSKYLDESDEDFVDQYM
ncbi:hypothetical protein Bhyg_02833 [Pseudolycoriella hygida]|uniref:Uncharacterized protein n=1 Tax=Pseudolycoriella hygida TaxID=35572 RepID=A0A9Q0NC56_9DIPT|nr:hypothetical protein Bhyg_02833 [Pseudolycoriella hygida]